MRLTKHTDYALRVLMHIGLNEGQLVRIADISRSFGISRNHLMKIARELGARGYLETVRGRHGGLRLARAPAEITVGAVVRDFEEDLALVECFIGGVPRCRVQAGCVLRGVLGEALAEFLGRLDRVTLADLLVSRRELGRLLATPLPFGGRSPATRTVD